MTFDALMLSAVADELRRTVLGGQIQRVVLSGALELGLEIYSGRRRRFLVCSAEAETARVCLTADRPRRESAVPTPFLLLLRKYVRDGRIVDIAQPPYERLLRLHVTKRDEEGTHVEVDLIIETMGRRSNALLVDREGLILDALRRAGPTRNPRRPVLPRRPYLEPPAQNRLDPLAAQSYEALAGAASSTSTLEAVLAGKLAGFSPLAAREVAFRATSALDSPADRADWGAVRRVVLELLEPLSSREWEPTIAYESERSIAFAPYVLTHLPGAEVRRLESPSEAVEQALAKAGPGTRPVGAIVRSLLDAIDAREAQAKKKQAALTRSLAAAEEAETLRRAGEAVLANLTLFEPGQAVLHFDGQAIELDPSLPPLENAHRLFREYRKARDAGRNVPELLAAADRLLGQLEDLRVMAELADSPARQRAIREELAELDGPKGQDTGTDARSARSRPPKDNARVARHRSPDGLEVLVGASGRGNDEVTFKIAGPDDLWLHARGVPGAHVILRTGGREPPPGSLEYAARLAARNSRARSAGRVEVDYTPRKHVRRIPASAPGRVTYSGERTIAVSPD